MDPPPPPYDEPPPPAYSKMSSTDINLTSDLESLVVAGELTRSQAEELMVESNGLNLLPPAPPKLPSATLPLNTTSTSAVTSAPYEPSVVVEMLRGENLSQHLRTICNIIADMSATTSDIDVAVRRATVQCFAAVNEHARVTESSRTNKTSTTIDGTTKEDDKKGERRNKKVEEAKQAAAAGKQESVDALTDFGVALSQMSAPVVLPAASSQPHLQDILQAHHLVDSWQRCGFIDDFQTITAHQLLESNNDGLKQYLHSVLNAPSPKKTFKTKRRSFMGMGGRISDGDKSSALPSPQQAATRMCPLLIVGLKRELAGMLLRQWDLGHATMELEGNDVASSVPSWDDRQLLVSPGRGGPDVLTPGSHHRSMGSSGGGGIGIGMGGDMSGSGSVSDVGIGVGKSGTGGFAEPGGSNSLSRRRASVTDGNKVTASYSLVPPDGTNVVAHVLKPNHSWEIRVEVSAEQSIVWEFRANPADKTLFSLRFNGDLMFPEAMLASQAPNAGSIRRVESGTYYLLFRNSGTKKTDKSIDIWCSVRSPGENDMMERREYVRSGRYVCMRDAFNTVDTIQNTQQSHNNSTPSSLSQQRMLQIGRVKSNRTNGYQAAMTCETHQGVRLWKRYLGHDHITGNTPVYLEFDGLFLAVVSKERLVYTARCDQATPFYVRWLHSQEELRLGAICELSTSWNMEMHILCRTATVSGTKAHSNGALPHWNLVLVAESIDANDRPFSGDSRKIFFAATLPGEGSVKSGGLKKKDDNRNGGCSSRVLGVQEKKWSQQIGGSGLLRGEYTGVGSARFFGYDYGDMYAKVLSIAIDNEVRRPGRDNETKSSNAATNAVENAWLSVAAIVGVADPVVVSGGKSAAHVGSRSRSRTVAGSPSAIAACRGHLVWKEEEKKSIQQKWQSWDENNSTFSNRVNFVANYVLEGKDTTEINERIDLILLGWNLLEARLGIRVADVLISVLESSHQQQHGDKNIVLVYVVQLLSSPAYASKILREPQLLEMLEEVGEEEETTVGGGGGSGSGDGGGGGGGNDSSSSSKTQAKQAGSSKNNEIDVHPSSPMGSFKRNRSSSTAAHDLALGTRYLGDDDIDDEETNAIVGISTSERGAPTIGTHMNTGIPFGDGTFKTWRYAEGSSQENDASVIVTVELHGWKLASGTLAVAHIWMTMENFRNYGGRRDEERNRTSLAIDLSATRMSTITEKLPTKPVENDNIKPISLVSQNTNVDIKGGVTASSKNNKPFTPPVIPRPVIRKSKNKRPWSRLRDYAYVVDDLAEHFFQRDLALYSAVPPTDFVCGSFTNIPEGNNYSSMSTSSENALPPPLAILLGENQHRLRWLQCEVLQEVDVVRRARTLEIVIDLALASRRLRNFQMLLCCYDALRSPPILRLVDTWSQVRAQRHEEFERLKRACAPFMNYRNLRRIVRSCTDNQPYIPCVVPLLIALRHVSQLPTLVRTTKNDQENKINDKNNAISINWAQLKVIQDTVKQFESPSLGILGSTLTKSIPKRFDSSTMKDTGASGGGSNALDNKQRRRSLSDTIISPSLGPASSLSVQTVMTPSSLAASGGSIHLGDFSLFTLSSPTILLGQSNLVEPPLLAQTNRPPPGHHTSYIYVRDPSIIEKERQQSQQSYSRTYPPVPPLSFENARRFAGVARLDQGRTTREVATEELLEMILMDDSDGSSGNDSAQKINPHAYHVNRFVREFSNMIRQPYPHGLKATKKKHSDSLLQHTVNAMCALSDRIVVDLELSSPWLLDDVDEAFDEDVHALESCDVDNSVHAREDDDEHRRKRDEQRRYTLKLHVRWAMTNSLLGRVGLRLWAAVRRDWVTADQHLERCRVAMSSVSDETLWELCSSGVGGEEDIGDEEPWPFFEQGWSDAVRTMDSVSRPSTPFSKMEALADVSSF